MAGRDAHEGMADRYAKLEESFVSCKESVEERAQRLQNLDLQRCNSPWDPETKRLRVVTVSTLWRPQEHIATAGRVARGSDADESLG